MCVVGEYSWNLGRTRGSVGVWGGGAEGRLQAPLMVLVGEKSGEGVNTGGWLERREDFKVSVVGEGWGRRGEECSRIGSM